MEAWPDKRVYGRPIAVDRESGAKHLIPLASVSGFSPVTGPTGPLSLLGRPKGASRPL